MRKILAGLALVSWMLTLCGCGTAPTPTIRVGVALYQQEDTFISTVAQSLQQKALEEEQARGGEDQSLRGRRPGAARRSKMNRWTGFWTRSTT